MALSLKDPHTDRLARELAALTGESLTETIRHALEAQLQRLRDRHASDQAATFEALMAISNRSAALPILDHRSDDEILGYDQNGVPS